MSLQQFKTNIQCANCVEKVTEPLNQAVGDGKWQVNLKSPERILTVEVSQEEISKVLLALAQAGYQGEIMNSK